MHKKIIFAILVLLDLFLLHMTGGYMYRGLTAVRLVGEDTAHFIGYYMLAAPFALGLIVSLIITVVCVKRFFFISQQNATEATILLEDN